MVKAPDIRPADVLFVWGRDFISDAIEFITDGPAHVALCVDNETIAEAQTGRLIGERPFSFYIETADRLEVWRDLTLTDADRAEMLRYASTLYGRPYDYALIPLELLHYVTGVDISFYHEGKARICSTFVYDVYSHVYRDVAAPGVDNPAPADERNGGRLTKIYEWAGGGEWEATITASA